MGQPAATSNPQSYYWRHAAVGIFSVIFLGILFSFFSSETVATTKRVVNTQTVIQLNEEVLSQIHSSQQAQINEEVAANLSPVSEVESKPVPNLTQTTLKIKAGHSLAAIFKKQQLSSQDLYRIMQKGPSVQVLTNLQPGHTLNIESDTEGQLYSLTYQVDKLQSININRNGDDFHVATSNKQVEKRVNFTEGQIQSSLFEAGKEAGLSDALVMEMAGIFGWDVDFALDIREGDKFSVLYEENFVEGKKYQTGNILAAEFTNQGKTFKAISFTDKSGRTNFYTPEGLSMRKAFLRTPVDFRRISSRFGNRKHPVLNRMRLHKGVDYAAPRGTPIRSSGDGKVIFKGNKGGYGRVIIVQHGSRYQTVYAHMNGFKRGIQVGKRVKQGQTIGFVGSSGRATGPHLHYEFRVNGSHRNPLTVKLPNSAPINPEFQNDFAAHTERLLAQLNAHKSTQIALHKE